MEAGEKEGTQQVTSPFLFPPKGGGGRKPNGGRKCRKGKGGNSHWDRTADVLFWRRNGRRVARKCERLQGKCD